MKIAGGVLLVLGGILLFVCLNPPAGGSATPFAWGASILLLLAGIVLFFIKIKKN
ncbi:MAG: hypothetical protein LBI44_08060 [Oscillospiraceae bacterium]|jgi:hypothetical protein|nr:hypothetical protein [Oscillospiraceae bacterium]